MMHACQMCINLSSSGVIPIVYPPIELPHYKVCSHLLHKLATIVTIGKIKQ